MDPDALRDPIEAGSNTYPDPQDCWAPYYLAADEAGKMNGEMAAEQGLAARYGEDGGEELGVELGLQHDQRPVHPGPAQVGRVLSQVHLTPNTGSCNKTGGSGSGYLQLRQSKFFITPKVPYRHTLCGVQFFVSFITSS